MRFIPTRVHGILDYIVGAILILAPSLLGFQRGGAETWVPVILGMSVIIYSLMTRYELGLVKAIPMRTHLTLDFIGGALLTVSPWLFDFADFVWVPHVVFGLLEMGAALMTHRQPAWETTPPASVNLPG